MLFRYDVTDKLWKMRHAWNSDFLATSRAPESSLVLGSHLWEVQNDSKKCTSEGRNWYVTNLTLHSCTSENFACDNAFCIAMERRCDAIEDCSDGSDEQDCRKLIRRQGYKKELTPVPKRGEFAKVNLSLNIIDIEANEQTDNRGCQKCNDNSDFLHIFKRCNRLQIGLCILCRWAFSRIPGGQNAYQEGLWKKVPVRPYG